MVQHGTSLSRGVNPCGSFLEDGILRQILHRGSKPGAIKDFWCHAALYKGRIVPPGVNDPYKDDVEGVA